MALPAEIRVTRPSLTIVNRQRTLTDLEAVKYAFKANADITEMGSQLSERGVVALYLERGFKYKPASHRLFDVNSIWMVETDLTKRKLVVHLKNGDKISKYEVQEQKIEDFVYLEGSQTPPAFDFP